MYKAHLRSARTAPLACKDIRAVHCHSSLHHWGAWHGLRCAASQWTHCATLPHATAHCPSICVCAGAQEPSSVTQRPASAVETSSKQPAGPKRSRSPSPQPEPPVNHKTAKAGAAGDGSLHGLTFRPAEALPASAALTGIAQPAL